MFASSRWMCLESALIVILGVDSSFCPSLHFALLLQAQISHVTKSNEKAIIPRLIKKLAHNELNWKTTSQKGGNWKPARRKGEDLVHTRNPDRMEFFISRSTEKATSLSPSSCRLRAESGR